MSGEVNEMAGRSKMGGSAALAALCLAAFGVSGCAWDYRKEIGLVSDGPDENQVVLNRPLEMPAQLPTRPEDLPTPQPGARSRVEPRPELDAQIALQGAASETGATPSAAENALLSAAGAGLADPEIRERLEREASERQDGVLLLDGLLGRDDETEGAALDPAAEAERLAEEARRQQPAAQ